MGPYGPSMTPTLISLSQKIKQKIATSNELNQLDNLLFRDELNWTELYWTILDDTLLYWSILDYTGLYRTMLGRLKILCRILEKLSTVGFYPTVITVWRKCSEGVGGWGWLWRGL